MSNEAGTRRDQGHRRRGYLQQVGLFSTNSPLWVLHEEEQVAPNGRANKLNSPAVHFVCGTMKLHLFI